MVAKQSESQTRAIFDYVVVGGGHNGMTAAFELARAGGSVFVAEAREKPGGCATTTEPLLSGFRHNPHANTFLFADLMRDAIKPASLGLTINQPVSQLGVAFADGRPPVILHRPDALEQTFASFRAYSLTDATTYVELKRRSARLEQLLRQGMYAAPDPGWFKAQQAEVRRTFRGFCRSDNFGSGSARELIDGLFEAPEIRILLYHLALETGVTLDEAGGDIAFLGYSLWIAGRWRIPIGGMQAYSDALHRLALDAGVTSATSTHVERVVIENGRAVAVETSSGQRMEATKAVLVAAPVLHLFDDLLDKHLISQAERAEVEAFRQASATSIGTSHYCLDTAPAYKSARYDPQINCCLKTIVGHDTPSDVLTQIADLRAGRLPRPAGIVRVHSLWDSTLAPAERHVAGVDSSFPAAKSLHPSTWRQVESAFPAAFLETWSLYLEDQHPQPIAMSCDCSTGFERRMLMRMGKQQYRTSISGLYLGGPGVYPGGGVHGACGYNAARTIIEDHAVRPAPS